MRRIPLGIVFMSIILVGAGCTAKKTSETTVVPVNDSRGAEATAPVTEKPAADAKANWWLTFDLPAGWHQTTKISGQDEPVFERLSKDNDLVLTSASKYYYYSSGMAADWTKDPKFSADVDFDATTITVHRMTANETVPKEAVRDSATGLLRYEICKRGEECEIAQSWNVMYYIDTKDGVYAVTVNGPHDAKTTATVESILTTFNY